MKDIKASQKKGHVNTPCSATMLTMDCRQSILQLVEQGPSGLMRLRERLQVIFDSHQVLTREAQMDVLRACSLTPLLRTRPWCHVTFAPHPLEEPSTS